MITTDLIRVVSQLSPFGCLVLVGLVSRWCWFAPGNVEHGWTVGQLAKMINCILIQHFSSKCKYRLGLAYKKVILVLLSLEVR